MVVDIRSSDYALGRGFGRCVSRLVLLAVYRGSDVMAARRTSGASVAASFRADMFADAERPRYGSGKAGIVTSLAVVPRFYD